jgi:hypothetical protein
MPGLGWAEQTELSVKEKSSLMSVPAPLLFDIQELSLFLKKQNPANKQNAALWAHNQASLGNITRFIRGGQKKEETQIWVSNGMRMEGVNLGGVRRRICSKCMA